uniref:Ig-like domain-containing protein n=1 Tax=Periophthalmus magnuspinnatus TaxID=409849 RepID=A0A3B4BG68_9GOBI
MRGIGALSFLVEPSVKLLLAPRDESGYQTLLCTAWGFDPHIEWISETQRSSGSKVSISLNADGRVVVSSELQVPQTEWKTGKVYSCQVSDKSLNRINKENVSPPLEELQQNATRLTVSCLLVGPSLDSFTVTWKINEQIESGGVHAEAPVLQSNGTQTLLSQLSLSAQDWHAHKRVTYENSTYSCVVRHESSPAPFTIELAVCTTTLDWVTVSSMLSTLSTPIESP